MAVVGSFSYFADHERSESTQDPTRRNCINLNVEGRLTFNNVTLPGHQLSIESYRVSSLQ